MATHAHLFLPDASERRKWSTSSTTRVRTLANITPKAKGAMKFDLVLLLKPGFMDPHVFEKSGGGMTFAASKGRPSRWVDMFRAHAYHVVWHCVGLCQSGVWAAKDFKSCQTSRRRMFQWKAATAQVLRSYLGFRRADWTSWDMMVCRVGSGPWMLPNSFHEPDFVQGERFIRDSRPRRPYVSACLGSDPRAMERLKGSAEIPLRPRGSSRFGRTGLPPT